MRTGRPNRHSEKDKKEMLKLYKEKKMIIEIANQFNCSKWSVVNILRQQNYQPRYFCESCGKGLIGNKKSRWCSKNCQHNSKRKYKNCIICNCEISRRDKDAKNKNVKYCDDCSSNLTTQTYSDIRKMRKSKLIEMKGGKCIICGYKKCMAALDFHHRNKKEKLFNLAGSGISSRNWADVLKEAEKCDLLCCRCHREIEVDYHEAMRKRF